MICTKCCCCLVASVLSDSVQPHRRQPTRLPRPWDSPGKNTGMGCHFLLQSRKVKSESEDAQLYPTLSDPMDFSLPGSSVHEIFQARVLEWGVIAFSLPPVGMLFLVHYTFFVFCCWKCCSSRCKHCSKERIPGPSLFYKHCSKGLKSGLSKDSSSWFLI